MDTTKSLDELKRELEQMKVTVSVLRIFLLQITFFSCVFFCEKNCKRCAFDGDKLLVHFIWINSEICIYF